MRPAVSAFAARSTPLIAGGSTTGALRPVPFITSVAKRPAAVRIGKARATPQKRSPARPPRRSGCGSELGDAAGVASTRSRQRTAPLPTTTSPMIETVATFETVASANVPSGVVRAVAAPTAVRSAATRSCASSAHVIVVQKTANGPGPRHPASGVSTRRCSAEAPERAMPPTPMKVRPTRARPTPAPATPATSAAEPTTAKNSPMTYSAGASRPAS